MCESAKKSSSSDKENTKLFSAIHIDDSLEDRLKVHGISKRNVRSIIREVFTDPNVLKLLSAEQDNPELDFPDVPFTRSKRMRKEIENFDDITEQECLEEYDWSSCALDSTAGIYGPEYVTDQYEDSACDFDWHKWLKGFHNEKQHEYDKADSEDDPDFNFLEELEECDLEDYRNDCSTRISKKELKGLIQEKRSRVTFIAPEMNSSISRNSECKVSSKGGKQFDITSLSQCKTLRQKLKLFHTRPDLKKLVQNAAETKTGNSNLFMNLSQRSQLEQQLQQHVQLLAQTCFSMETNMEHSDRCSMYLKELEFFKNQSPYSNSSSFNIFNLSEAIQITDLIKSKSLSTDQGSPETMTCFEENLSIIAGSKVFMYIDFLHNFGTSNHHKKRNFSVHEDSLIAYGLEQMQGFFISALELTSIYMMPMYSHKSLSSRISIVLRGNSYAFLHNPISQFKMFGSLPSPCEKVGTVHSQNAKCPIEMNGELPDWLIRLQKGQQSMNVIDPTNRFNTHTEEILSARNIKVTPQGFIDVFWTRDMDEKILRTCKKHGGPTTDALVELQNEITTRNRTQMKLRFLELLEIYDHFTKKNILNFQGQ